MMQKSPPFKRAFLSLRINVQVSHIPSPIPDYKIIFERRLDSIRDQLPASQGAGFANSCPSAPKKYYRPKQRLNYTHTLIVKKDSIDAGISITSAPAAGIPFSAFFFSERYFEHMNIFPVTANNSNAANS